MIALLLTCLGAASTADVQFADGIYFVSRAEEGTAIERVDGTRIFITDLATKAFGAAKVTSVVNDNSRYRLDLTNAGPFSAEVQLPALAICLDGICLSVVSQSDLHPDRTVDLIAYVPGQELAERVAKSLGIKPRARQHPGHILVARWKPVKPWCQPGEPVVLRMEIENAGPKTVCFQDGGRQRGARNNQFAFIAHSRHGHGPAVPDTGDPQHYGGLGGHRTLGPGETFKKEVDVTKWFKFDKPGSYKLTCLYQTELFERDVTFATWDEYVVGDCIVVIRAGETHP